MKRLINEDDVLTCVGKALHDILNLPSSQSEPERKTGRWIKDSDGVIVCSECQEVALQRLFLITDDMRYEARIVESNYCPNCGARMEGESE